MPRLKKKSAPFEETKGADHERVIAEVLSVGLFVIGALLILAILRLGGRIGDLALQGLTTVFGLAAFVVPFGLIGLSLAFFKSSTPRLKPLTLIGLGLIVVTVPGFFFSNGGLIGQAISLALVNLLGLLGAVIVLLAATAIGLILATNFSLKKLQSRWLNRRPAEGAATVQVHHGTGIPLFETMRRITKPTPSLTTPLKLTQTDQEKTLDTSWELPNVDLLELHPTKADPGNVNRNVELIHKTLKDFGIEVTMSDVHIGPTVTQYTLKPAEGVKLAAITARVNDLALVLASHPIRIEAPIPGKAAVGIEVPNKQVATVTIREIIETPAFKAIKFNLGLALGRNVAGEVMVTDLGRMPHLLIAGATGSGKSVCLNGILMSLLYQNSPNQLKLILVDPKRVEFTRYNNIPHLLTPVITEVDKTINALRWTIAEMDRRFNLFQQYHTRDIDAYNAKLRNDPLPYIVVLIDELADLMSQASSEVEAAIVRLAQMARATGIHLVVATQRPSVDVITGLIKANIPARIAFAVASQVDSRTIIDSAGAERLLGNGDMLFLTPELGKPRRIQGVFITDREVKSVTDFLKNQAQPQYDETIVEYRPAGRLGMAGAGPIDDELFEEAKLVVTAAQKASASLLQRRLRIGYARAARLLDLLEHQGVIGPADGAKPREVLIALPTAGHQIPYADNRENQSYG